MKLLIEFSPEAVDAIIEINRGRWAEHYRLTKTFGEQFLYALYGHNSLRFEDALRKGVKVSEYDTEGSKHG